MRASSYRDLPPCVFLQRELDRRKPSIDCDKANSVLHNIKHDLLDSNSELDIRRISIGNRLDLREVFSALLPHSASEVAYHKHGALDVLLLCSDKYRDDVFFEYPLDQVVSHPFIPVTLERCRKNFTVDGKPSQTLAISFQKHCEKALALGMKQTETDGSGKEFFERSDFLRNDIARNYSILSLIRENASLVKDVTIALDFESNRIPISNPLLNVKKLTVYRSILDLEQVTRKLVGDELKPSVSFDYVILDSEDDNTQYVFLAMMDKWYSYLVDHVQLEKELAVTIIKDKFRLFEHTELEHRLFKDSDKRFSELPSPGRLQSYDTLGNSDSVMIRLLALFRTVASRRVPSAERSKYLLNTLKLIEPEIAAIISASHSTANGWSQWTSKAIEAMLKAVSDFSRVKLVIRECKKLQDKTTKLEDFLRGSSYLNAQEYLEESHPGLDWRICINDLKAIKNKFFTSREHEFNLELNKLLDKIDDTLDCNSIRTEYDNTANSKQIADSSSNVNALIKDCILHYSKYGMETDTLNAVSMKLSEHMMDLLAFTGKCD